MQYLSWANPQTTHSEYNWVELEASHQARLLTSFQHKKIIINGLKTGYSKLCDYQTKINRHIDNNKYTCGEI
jgi:hypothetical protein